MPFLRFLLGLALALAVHAFGQRFFGAFAQLVDPVLILVLYHSLRSRRGWDILGGSAAGLAYDAVTGGIYGQYGLVDTVVAAVCARLRQQLVLQRPGRLGVLFALLALVQQTVLAAVRFLVLAGAEQAPLWSVMAKMATTGVLGVAVFVIGSRLRRRAVRWREVRRRKLTIETR